MTSPGTAMSLTSRNARIAGLLYLLIVLAAPVRLVYIPATLFVSGNATATVANIAAHESLFRFGMVSDVLVGCLQVFLALAFYRLFRDVDRRQAMLIVIFGGVLQAAMFFFNVLNDSAALLLLRGGDWLATFDPPQRDSLALLFLRLHGQLVTVAETLWGVWLFPLAILVRRCARLPRVFAVLLIVNGLAYLAQSFTGLLLPQFADAVSTIAAPAQFVEIAFMLWLAIIGLGRVHVRATVPAL